MDTEFTLGKMAECMKVTISMIRKLDLVSTHGQMAGSTMACGKMENRTVKASTSCHRECSDEASGEMAPAKGGLTQPVN